MDNTSQFQSEMFDLFPEHENLDKLNHKNLIKDIAIDLVNFRIQN